MSKKQIRVLSLIFSGLIFVPFLIARGILDANTFNEWFVDNIYSMVSILVSLMLIVLTISTIRLQIDEYNYAKKPIIAIDKRKMYNNDLYVSFKNYTNNPAYEVNISFSDSFKNEYISLCERSKQIYKNKEDKVTNDIMEMINNKIGKIYNIQNYYIAPNDTIDFIIFSHFQMKSNLKLDKIKLEFTLEYKRNPNDKESIREIIAIYI